MANTFEPYRIKDAIQKLERTLARQELAVRVTREHILFLKDSLDRVEGTPKTTK